MGNIIQDGVIMLIVLAVIFICWLVLSTPFETVISSFEDVDMANSDAKVEDATGWMRTAWHMIFAGLGAVPIIWFIFRMFQREPEWRY